MNLGSAFGAAVRESLPVRSPAANIGAAIGTQIREQVAALQPVRYEIWQTADDERTCPVCAPLHGKIWRDGEGFAPPLHDHCRCQRLYHHTEFRNR